jgi:hypothetical protein
MYILVQYVLYNILAFVCHHQALHTVKHQEHLKNVPDYIIPETLKRMTGGGGGKNKQRQFKTKTTETQKRFNKRKADPLDMGLAKRKR